MEVQLVLAVVLILAMLFTKLNQRLPKPRGQQNREREKKGGGGGEGQIKGLFQLIDKSSLFVDPWDYYIRNA